MSEVFTLLSGEPIYSHAFNKEGNRVVLCSNSNNAYIYFHSKSEWVLEHVLKEHIEVVSSVDWAPETNRIVTCSHDRNAYVWSYENGTWKPNLVMLRTNMSAICVKWSPKEDKIAVGTGSRLIAICNYDEENDWWISRHIKKPISGTILKVAWHPSGKIIAAACTDMKVHVFSAVIGNGDKEVDGWGSIGSFGTNLCSFGSSSDGWAHAVCFSISGTVLAWSSHSSLLLCARKDREVIRIHTKHLPFMDLAFASDDIVIAAGHDNAPFAYKIFQDSVKPLGQLASRKTVANSNSSTAFSIFKNLDSKSQYGTPSSVEMAHENTITSVIPLPRNGFPKKITTSSCCGKLAVWDLESCVKCPIVSEASR